MGRMIQVVAEPMDGDRFPVVRGRSDARAVERLQPLGVGHRHIEAAGDVARDVDAPDRDRVDMDEPPRGEHADRGRAAAEIDHRGAELGLVVDQRREARGVGRGHHRLDPQVAAFDHQHEIARRGQLARGDMQVDSEILADHALGIVDVAGGVEREGGRQPMQHGASGKGARRGCGLQHPVDVVLRHRLAAQSNLGVEPLRRQESAGHVDDHAADLDPGHPLGRVDREPGRMLGRLQIDDRSALDPVRALMADAENLAAVGAPAQRGRRLHRVEPRDQTDDFRGADVENREDRRLAGGICLMRGGSGRKVMARPFSSARAPRSRPRPSPASAGRRPDRAPASRARARRDPGCAARAEA